MVFSSFCPLPSHIIAILSLTMNSSTWFFSMNWLSVSKTRYLVNSCVLKTSPLVARLQMARLNTFRVKSSSIREQFSRRAVLRASVMLYLLTRRPWREKFSQITAMMARISLRRVLFWSSSQSMRNTVTRNLRVKGKQNLGFSLMSSAMIESTYSILNSMLWSWASSFQDKGKLTYSWRPRRVKWFIILRMRSTQVMKTDVQPFLNRCERPCKQRSKCSPQAWRISQASWCMALAASVSSAASLTDSKRNSKGGFSNMMGEQEVQDQADPDDAISIVLFRDKRQKIIIHSCLKNILLLFSPTPLPILQHYPNSPSPSPPPQRSEIAVLFGHSLLPCPERSFQNEQGPSLQRFIVEGVQTQGKGRVKVEYREKRKEEKDGWGVVLQCIMNEYKILNIIGQGAFGNAYLATHLKSNQNFVIKKIELTNKSQEQTENIFNEVKLLEEFKHVNIVSYRQSIIEGQELNIIMEFCYGGDLNQLILEQKENQGGRKLEEKKIVDWAAQIALAIFYMHDKRILHRDLKTPNIFISDNIVKLGDFGISKVLDEKVDLASTSIGTPYYMSPEQYRHKPYSYKSDIWAFGCILYEMCNQKRPFEAYSLNGLAVKVLEANFAPVSEFYSRQLREIINKMLQKKEKERPSILQFLQTPLIKKRAAAYLKETHQKLVKENGDKVLIEGVLYQAKKLGIALAQKKQVEQKKVKPQFSAQKKRQEKERIRLQLEEQLKKISQKDKQQKEELRRLTQDRKNLLNRGKREDKYHFYGKKPSSAATKASTKEQSTVASESRHSSVSSARSKEEKRVPFEIKEKYDMYEMEYEEQEESEDERGVEPIDEVEEEEETKPEPGKQYQKEKYSKPVAKQTKVEAARFSQLAAQQSSTRQQPEVPIEEAIINLKESLKMNFQKLNTIKNQLSNIDFEISSSDDDELQKTIQKSEEMPVMRKKEKNPVHVALSDKTNDLRQALESILPKNILEKVVRLAQSRGQQVSRGEIEKIVGAKVGTYHLACELVKLNSMLQRIPLYS